MKEIIRSRKIKAIINKDFQNKLFEAVETLRRFWNWALDNRLKKLFLDHKYAAWMNAGQSAIATKEKNSNPWLSLIPSSTYWEVLKNMDKSFSSYIKNNKQSYKGQLCQFSSMEELNNIKRVAKINKKEFPNEKQRIEAAKAILLFLPQFKRKKDMMSITFNKENINKLSTYLGNPKSCLLTLHNLAFLKEDSIEPTIRLNENIYNGLEEKSISIANIKSVTLTYNNSWYASISFSKTIPEAIPTGPKVGIDVGFKRDNLMVCERSDGTNKTYKNPYYNKIQDLYNRVAFLQNKQSKKTKWSNNWYKLQKKINKINTKITNVREWEQHQIANEIVGKGLLADKKPVQIHVESLSIKDMISKRRKKKLDKKERRKFGRMGVRSLLQKIEYKSEEENVTFAECYEHFPSTQICNNCKKRNKVEWYEETWMCKYCGEKHHRDHNAAKNILECPCEPKVKKEGGMTKYNKDKAKKKALEQEGVCLSDPNLVNPKGDLSQ